MLILFDDPLQRQPLIDLAKKELDWEEVPTDELYELDDASALLNKQFELKQVYEVEIFSKDVKNDHFSNFNIAVGANASRPVDGSPSAVGTQPDNRWLEFLSRLHVVLLDCQCIEKLFY